MTAVLCFKNGNVTAEGSATKVEVDAQQKVVRIARAMTYDPYIVDLKDIEEVFVDTLLVYESGQYE